MKILIADSGSTNTQWAWCDTANPVSVVSVQTQGLNPVYCTATDVEQAVQQVMQRVQRQFSVCESPDAIYFYGAGCAGERCEAISLPLHTLYHETQIEVQSDMLGACRALLAERRGVACILGTGSNSCLYDGHTMVANIPPLGFILGDEGSGGVLGKNLVADYLKGQMSAEAKTLFEKKYGILKQAEVIERVYRQPMPSRYLAAFAPFLIEYADLPYCQQLVSVAFDAFFKRAVAPYKNMAEAEIIADVNPDASGNLEVGFVGSVAYHFRNMLVQEAEHYGYTIGQVLQSPMEGLIQYHINKINKK